MLGDAHVRFCHMDAMLRDVVEAIVHVYAGLCLSSSQLNRFERSPGRVAFRQIFSVAAPSKSKNAAGASEDMKLQWNFVRDHATYFIKEASVGTLRLLRAEIQIKTLPILKLPHSSQTMA